MLARLPQPVDPWRLAGQGKLVAGKISLAALRRVADLLLDPVGDVDYEFRFTQDDHGRVRIDGFVKANMNIRCQRCLDAMALPVDASPQLVVIEVDAEAERIPEDCEPVMAQEGSLSIVDLIEDELLLAIPQVPMHDPSSCKVDLAALSHPAEAAPGRDTDRENPFAVLSALRTDEKN